MPRVGSHPPQPPRLAFGGRPEAGEQRDVPSGDGIHDAGRGPGQQSDQEQCPAPAAQAATASLAQASSGASIPNQQSYEVNSCAPADLR